MTGTKRIRWYAEAASSVVAHTGIIADPGFAAFQIFAPGGSGGEHILTCSLPGVERYRHYADDPDELKAEAERWLERFIVSLGAAFPEEPVKEAGQ